MFLRCGIFFDYAFDLSFVRCPILLEQVVCIRLGWRFGIGIIEQVLNADEDLPDGDCWLPTFFFVQDRETDCARRVDIWMEKRGREFAFWWLRRVFIRKRECELEQATLPNGLFLPWYAHFPILEVKDAVGASDGSCKKAERMIATPLFPLLLEAIEAERHGEAKVGIGRSDYFDEKSRWSAEETFR